MVETSRKEVCLVIGAGDGLGSAVARAFAREGHPVCVTRRARHEDKIKALADEITASGGEAHGFGVDARNEEETAALFDRIECEIGPIGIVVYNIGANVKFDICDTSTRVFTKVWEMACLGGFLAGREAARVMQPRGKGTILFTGATASLRGGAGFSAFASAKAGLRMVSQSMARELGPKGIHVAHIICDGAIDGTFIRSLVDDVEPLLAADKILKPDDIAGNYVMLHKQPRSAWTQELDLRPWLEKW